MVFIIGLVVLIFFVIVTLSLGALALAIAALAFGTWTAFMIGGFIGVGLTNGNAQAGFAIGSILAVVVLWTGVANWSNLKEKIKKKKL